LNNNAQRLPVVAIVGRQNVGKSTLLNRLTGRRLAIVEDLPGTTRDRLKAEAEWLGRRFNVVDTGGLELMPGATFGAEINQQIKRAIAEADVILFMVDAVEGLMPSDAEVAGLLRPAGKPVILVANKADNLALGMNTAEFYQLGLGQPFAVSAYHGRGISELLDAIMARLPETEEPAREETGPATDATPRLAIVGRPNVGKSALLNALLGEERVIVSAVPGTTRDAIDTQLDFGGRGVILIDTAGIKRRGRQGQGVDRYSAERSMRAIERADVALLVLDAAELVTAQDLHIAGYIQEALKGIVIVVNKWDLATEAIAEDYNRTIRARLKFFGHAPVVFTSAKTGANIQGVLPAALKVYDERQKRIPTAQLNSAVQQVISQHTPPHKGDRMLKFLYATQAEINPPTFVFFVNDPTLMHFSYQRFLDNELRGKFGFEGTPLRLIFKSRGEKKA
jgi:GTPase